MAASRGDSLYSQYRWKNERSVLLLDQFGTPVDGATLKATAKIGAIDICCPFRHAGLYRQAATHTDALEVGKQSSLMFSLGGDVNDGRRSALKLRNPA